MFLSTCGVNCAWRDLGLTMVLVTHDSSIARRAQRAGIMKNGKLTVTVGTGAPGTPAPVTNAPAP